jgi:hypothetical protein
MNTVGRECHNIHRGSLLSQANESCIVEDDDESESGLGYQAPLATDEGSIPDASYRFMDSDATLSNTLLKKLHDGGFSSEDDAIEFPSPAND